MSQSLALVLVHIIFSTKNRMPFLQSAELRSEVHAYLTGPCGAWSVTRFRSAVWKMMSIFFVDSPRKNTAKQTRNSF